MRRCPPMSPSSWTATDAGPPGAGLPRVAGHRAGAQAVRRTIEAAMGAGIGWLTLYAFSSENWSRPPSEVLDLTGLLRHYVRQELAELKAQGVRLRVIGDRTRFDADICADLDRAERETAGNARLNLNVALSYGARAEIAAAARRAAEAVRAGYARPGGAGRDGVRQLSVHLRHARPRPGDPHQRRAPAEQLPAVAVGLCRVGVHRRAVAGFRCAPEFDAALAEFARRERRFGARPG